jgi:hypothetical protein
MVNLGYALEDINHTFTHFETSQLNCWHTGRMGHYRYIESAESCAQSSVYP